MVKTIIFKLGFHFLINYYRSLVGNIFEITNYNYDYHIRYAVR